MSSFRSLVRALGSVLVCAGIVAVVIRERALFADAAESASNAKPLPLAMAMIVLFAGYGVIPVVAWSVACARIARVDRRAAATAWLRSSLAKYVPGFVWHPFTAVDRLTRAGSSVTSAILAFAADMSAWVAGAVLVGLIALPTLIGLNRGSTIWLVLTVPAVAALHPRVFAFVARMMTRVTGANADDVQLDWVLVATIVGLHTLGWFVMGSALVLVVAGLGIDLPVGLVVGSAALSWVAGYLFIIAPAGLGVRDAVLAAILATKIPLSAALGAAVLWRAMFVLVDVLSFAASAVIQRVDGSGKPVEEGASRTDRPGTADLST